MSKNSETAINLGKRIRELRLSMNLKIVDVAKMTGLTASMISQVERAAILPSIETLKKLGDALDTPISHFFQDVGEIEQGMETQNAAPAMTAEVSPVVHAHQRKILSPNPGINFFLLNPNMNGPIEFIYNVYEPNAKTGDGLYSHEGFECGLILEGELEVQVGDQVYRLNAGDSITFESTQPHAKRNIGDKPCVCVWANTPPWF